MSPDAIRDGQTSKTVAMEFNKRGGDMAGRADKVDITDRWLRALRNKKHPGKPRLVFRYDAVVPGLNLLWTPTALSWGMTKRWPGSSEHPSWRSLGAVYEPPKPQRGEKVTEQRQEQQEIAGGALTLAEARAKARRWLDLLSRGIDPAAEEKRVRTENRRRYTFAQVRDEHIKHHWKRKGLAKADEAERLLRKEFAAWDDRPAADITAQDVDEAIQVIVDRGAEYQAHNAFGYGRGLYTWLIANPRFGIKESPFAGLSPVKMIGAKKSRTRWLSDKELRDVWNAAGKLSRAGPVIKLLCLTPQRLNEIAGLSWSEIDLDKGEIVIPANRPGVKNKVDHLVPLTPKAIEILRAIPKTERGDCVFSTTDGAKPMTIGSKIKKQIDALLPPDMKAWIWHDLRRSVRTNFTKLGIPEEVREALMAHVKTGLIKTYDMHDWADEKRDGLMRWEARLMSIVNQPPSDVADLAEVRAGRAGA
jgi:integrase